MRNLFFLLIFLSSCQPSLDRQPRLKVYQKEIFFADQSGDRSPLKDTYTYSPNGKNIIKRKPMDRAMLKRGKERFEIFCVVCHGKFGSGHGIVTQHGFLPPPSFHSSRLRQVSDEHLFDVITNGHGRMTRLGDRMDPQERWEVIGYIRALQLSQHFPKSSLRPEEKGKIKK